MQSGSTLESSIYLVPSNCTIVLNGEGNGDDILVQPM